MSTAHRALLGFAAVILAACNQAEAPNTPAGGDSGVTPWTSVLADDIGVPEGVSYTQAAVDGTTVAQIGAVPVNATLTGATGGVSIRLPAEFEAQASGARVQLTVRAFAPQDGALLGVAYSTNELGNSGWQRFVLTTAPRDYVFAYNVAPGRGGAGDFLGFRSHGAGAVQIVGYKVEIVPPPPATTGTVP